ncbi:MAG: diguanylate cyclase [Lacrimispora sp.]|uniref:diguanylate cyclase domain-containing protein n=1 Tax=Lacrimispora sp. TaxID=2719234 RepID=UPI0039E4B536
MRKNEPFPQKASPLLVSMAAVIVLLSICLSFILMLHNNIRQRAVLETTDRYMVFESRVQRLIYSNVTLLQGYEAYIKLQPDLIADISYRYMDELLSTNSDYIRNVGVLRDTTIIWNYPQESNSEAIGVDLSTVEGQKDLVLKVKHELKPILQGPVDLVQGGRGFIVRLPIVMEDMEYWGQIAIVLEPEKILAEIESYAVSSGLDIAIFNQENKTTPFFGSVDSNVNSKLEFAVDPDFINWNITVSSSNGWEGNLPLFVLLFIFSVLLSSSGGILVYKYIRSNNKIIIMSVYDSLSGLFNRHFLNSYQANAFAAAKRKEYKLGILLLDLDFFKKINDTYGHSVGDMVLVETARILKESTGPDEMAFRLGGDEFLLILPEIESMESLRKAKERLLNRFEEEFHVPGYPIKVSPSIGYAIFPEDGSDLDTILHRADKLMYLEKSKRRSALKEKE